MKHILVSSLCIVILGFSVYGQTSRYQSLKQMEWLTGYWKGMYNGAPFYEAWVKAHDSLIVNLAIEIKDADTSVRENGYIRLQKGKIIHGSTNASWQLTELTDSRMVFENDTLKFANKIIWSHSANDHWIAEIHNPSRVINYDLERTPWLKRSVDNFISRSRKSSGN